MSTIYHKGGKSLPLPNPLYSVRNEMIMATNKTMAPFRCQGGRGGIKKDGGRSRGS